jgi:hypothetical protein
VHGSSTLSGKAVLLGCHEKQQGSSTLSLSVSLSLSLSLSLEQGQGRAHVGATAAEVVTAETAAGTAGSEEREAWVVVKAAREVGAVEEEREVAREEEETEVVLQIPMRALVSHSCTCRY